MGTLTCIGNSVSMWRRKRNPIPPGDYITTEEGYFITEEDDANSLITTEENN
jgi:hypothetical protein